MPKNYLFCEEDEHGHARRYDERVVTYSNDAGKGKYVGVPDWAKNDEERCEEYVSRLKTEFLERSLTYWDGSGYDEVRCRRKSGHKGACLNNRPYPGD